MYDLFLTCVVPATDFRNTLNIFSGLCEMAPWSTVNRVLHFQGPRRPSGLPNQAAVDRNLRDPAVPGLWRDLHAVLSRQSYILHLRYEVDREKDLGTDRPPVNFNARPGMLVWADFPDVPSQTRPCVTQRKRIDIWDQKNLLRVMQDNNYMYKDELFEETHQFFRDGVEFRLYRHRLCRPRPDMDPSAAAASAAAAAAAAAAGPLPTLPVLDDMPLHDAEGRWLLYVRTTVLAENRPEELRDAQERLMAVRNELEGLIDFLVVDRKVFDSRIAMEVEGVQVLPQKVTLGT